VEIGIVSALLEWNSRHDIHSPTQYSRAFTEWVTPNNATVTAGGVD